MKRLCIAALIAVLTLPAQAQTEPEVRLSLQQALEMALRNNLELQAERLGPRLSLLDLEATQGLYGLTLGARTGLNQGVSPSAQSFISGGSLISQMRQTYNLSLTQNLATGGDIGLDFGNQISDTNSTRVDINPAIVPRLELSLNQPLLRSALNGYRDLAARSNEVQAAEFQLKARAIATVSSVQDVYWDLVLFQERLRVVEQSVKILGDLLIMNQEKEKAGFMSRIDVLQTEARIAARQGSLLELRLAQQNTEDRLKRLLNPLHAQSIAWDARLSPTDQPDFKTVETSLERSLATAFEARPDYQSLQIGYKNAELARESAAQNRLPALALTGAAGLESLDQNYGTAIGKLFGFQTYFWNVGLNFELPVVGNRFEAAYQQAMLRTEQQRLLLENARQQLTAELRQAVRSVQVNASRVEANRKAKSLADEQLKAQTEKLNLGLTTNFQVLQFQEDFENASLSEVNAVIDYIKAVNALRQAEGVLLEVRNIPWPLPGGNS